MRFDDGIEVNGRLWTVRRIHGRQLRKDDVEGWIESVALIDPDQSEIRVADCFGVELQLRGVASAIAAIADGRF